MRRNRVLGVGFLLYAATCLGFALFANESALWLLFACYGIFIGLTDGVTKAYIADLSKEEESGMAFGVYYMLTGLVFFPANMRGGLLRKYVSPQAPFFFAAGVAILSAVGLFLLAKGYPEKIK